MYNIGKIWRGHKKWTNITHLSMSVVRNYYFIKCEPLPSPTNPLCLGTGFCSLHKCMVCVGTSQFPLHTCWKIARTIWPQIILEHAERQATNIKSQLQTLHRFLLSLLFGCCDHSSIDHFARFIVECWMFDIRKHFYAHIASHLCTWCCSGYFLHPSHCHVWIKLHFEKFIIGDWTT